MAASCVHCAVSASRRFVIQPSPEYSAASRPITPTVPAWLIACSTTRLSMSLIAGLGTAEVIEVRNRSSRSGLPRSTKAAAAKPIISSGTSARTLKYVIAAA